MTSWFPFFFLATSDTSVENKNKSLLLTIGSPCYSSKLAISKKKAFYSYIPLLSKVLWMSEAILDKRYSTIKWTFQPSLHSMAQWFQRRHPLLRFPTSIFFYFVRTMNQQMIIHIKFGSMFGMYELRYPHYPQYLQEIRCHNIFSS